ncbi:zinc-binding alcohol dehydrogenase family protein [Dactylosporangium vinaceum]|uniref:Zinc-binding alcohol dehydrogenase family protein n=1 Tax=Dactylosporangium vinaceum TaxID=53362 RepID=A0ABV5MA59_9ACTN|nr:zinc-binding alcohol dehydrogenase family protein [Dactylosporangium vinaceum]UAB93095.1 zinc-binding alcohol dehydrogenase family protein [Dactylosporangium vinaceum]
MRAAVILQCGQPPVVADHDFVPGAGRAVTVTAAPITPLDVLCATGTSYFGAPAVPYIPGVQGVGHLEDGTPVWFATDAGMRPGNGSMAQYATVPPDDVVALPSDADPALVAALGLSAVAAWQSLTSCGDLHHGEQVLVLGGGGIVGQAAIQIARLLGARRVVAACRSTTAQTRATTLGADAVVALLDSDTPAALAGRLRAALDGPLDLVLDPLFGIPAAAALQVLRPGGRLVNLGGSASPTAPFDSATLRSGSLRILGYTNNSLTKPERAETMRTIATHAAAGRLTVSYEAVPLSEAASAWTAQSTGSAPSRLVLLPH